MPQTHGKTKNQTNNKKIPQTHEILLKQDHKQTPNQKYTYIYIQAQQPYWNKTEFDFIC